MKVNKNIILNRIKDIIKSFSIIYTLYYLVFAFLLYLPISYFILFFLTKSAEELNFDLQKELIFNLLGFFLHLTELNKEFWNIKEIIHYTEVRFIYDILFLIFIFSLILIKIFKINRNDINKAINKGFLIAHVPLLIIPIFGFFWNNIFHIVLFNNNFWILEPTDISFYLFNDYFFIGFIIFWYILVFIFYLILKKINKKNNNLN